jgi:hypothetical protein
MGESNSSFQYQLASRNMTRPFARQISGTLTCCSSSTTGAAQVGTGLAVSPFTSQAGKDPGYSTREEKARRIPGSVAGQTLAVEMPTISLLDGT